MTLRRILVPFEGYACDFHALRAALALAKAHHAHVEAWHVSPDPLTVMQSQSGYPLSLDSYFPQTVWDGLDREYAAKRNRARRMFIKAIQGMQVERQETECAVHYATASFHAVTGDADQVIPERGLVCDLIIMGVSSGRNNDSGVLTDVLFKAGRPLLLVPPGKSARALNGGAIVAWNGSVEAAHAVEFALPLLEPGKVWVLTADGATGAIPDTLPPQGILSYLKMHGVRARPAGQDEQRLSPPEAILQAARKMDAGLIVMGAYGHSKILETLFGGTTDSMMKRADVPVLLAH